MTHAEDDIVSDFLDRLRHLHPGFPPGLADELERQIRINWGGQQPYIAARPNADRAARIAAAVAALDSGAPAAEVIRKHGVSKSTLYRLLKQRAER